MSHVIDRDELPFRSPTHCHEAVFWEELGRTVATFGFLEEVLGKAIFAFTATKPYPEEGIEEAYKKWLHILRKALSDPLGNLIDSYENAVRNHPDATIENIEELISQLREASRIRNALCHGSWRPPDADGASIPFVVNRQMERFDTPVDLTFLRQTQCAAAEMACEVINTVTHMGWRFPGGAGYGKPI